MHREASSWPKAKGKRKWPLLGSTDSHPRRDSKAGTNESHVQRRKSATSLVIPESALVGESSPQRVRRKSVSSELSASGRRTERRLTPDEEMLLVDSAREAIERHPGCLISSLKKNPAKRAFGSTNRAGMSIVTHHIVVGSGENAKDLKTLKQYGITHVLNVAVKLPNFFPDKLGYLKLELIDSVDCNVLEHAQKAFDFIQRVENLGGRVLVHCVAGVSRSITIVLMYLIAVHSLRLRHAWEYVVSVRPFISPNEGFRLQLAKLELRTFGESSVANYHAKEWDFFEWNNIKTSCKPYEYQAPLCIVL